MDLQMKKLKKPTKVELTKEQIRQAIVKKRECNAKAQTIVESLLETGVTETCLLQCLPDINQSHFEDVIEERSIIHLCGYPLCSNTLSERDIPKQKYRISVKTNKVYDITARKSFCSNNCYMSAMHVKKQMLTSPLWFREYEEVPKFHLLPLDAVGSLGLEVDVAIVRRIGIKPMEAFTSANDFASASLHEITGDETQNNDESNKKHTEESNQCGSGVQENNISTECADPSQGENLPEQKDLETQESIDTAHNFEESKNTSSQPQQIENSVSKSADKSNKDIQKKSPNPLNIVGEIIERPERKIDPILCDTHDSKTSTKHATSPKKMLQKKQPSVTAITIEVERCLAEWFTLDTLIFLFGKEKVNEMVADKGECIKDYLENYAKSIFYNSNTYDQYQALCKKLNMLEVEDRRSAQAIQRETKPLPDYSIIQEESKRMQLKVKAFLSGETVIPESDTLQKETVTGDNNVTQLPLVDKNAQNALRRRIVCEHLNKVLPDLLRSLGLLSLSITSDVRLIVNTFKLKANNIMFKPIQWILIAIVIVKLLSLRDRRLEYLLQTPIAFQHMQLLLLSFKHDGGYLDRLTSWLTDIDRLLNTNDVQMTSDDRTERVKKS